MSTSSTTPFGVVLLLWCAGLGAAMQFSKFSFVFETLGGLYPDAGVALGFTVSLLSFMGILLGLFAGLFVARIGFARVLIVSLLIGAAMSMVQAFLPPLSVMLLSRLIEGLSQIGIVVAAPTLIGLLSAPKHRGFTMSLWGTFFGVAYAITNLVAPFITNALGISGLFFAHAILMVAMAGALLMLLPKSEVMRASGEVPKLATIPALHARIYSSPFMAAPALGWLCYTLTYVSLMTLLPSRIAEADRLFTVTAMPLAGIVSSMTLGVFLLRFIPAYRLAIIGFVLAAACAFSTAIYPQFSPAYIALFASLGLVQGGSFAAIPQLNSSAQAQANANGALAQMGNLGNTLGTPILLALFGLGGFPGMMGAVLLIFISAIVVHLWAAVRRASPENRAT